MRSAIDQQANGNWSFSTPYTNVLWLNYVADRLLNHKGLPTPALRASARNHQRTKGVLVSDLERRSYDKLFAVSKVTNPKHKSLLGDKSGLCSAADVLRFIST